MSLCPVCSVPFSQDAVRCSACGASLTVAAPTIRQPSSPSGQARSSGKSSSSPTRTTGQGSFVTGTILATRYRIVGLLGRGGMGEVYKAEDLNLDQLVAIKFLPESFLHDETALSRFRGEVRIARQVTHQNVCRVFDIGEFEGRHFLTMEYIDGEDLSSLLRRIGRLPDDKALEVSRQICAGLTAAHSAGVLHRDLKPANVMIDGRGKARITDFGIAGLEEDLKKGGQTAGTLAYMAPEQMLGEEVTVQSDIYSLGLVLYELFTGRPGFQSSSINELIKKRQTTTPTAPSEVLKEIDPLVEKTILRCLERVPQDRPTSAMQVAAMLPGGDPLAAALAAGETPSPEMVAAAPTKGALRLPIAVACLIAGVLLLGFCMYGATTLLAQNRIPFTKSPEVLSERANEIIAKLGYTDASADRYYRFYTDDSYLQYVKGNALADGWEKLSTGQPVAVVFTEAQSPNYFHVLMRGNGFWETEAQNQSGMRTISLDTRARLIEFRAVPPSFTSDSTAPTTVDWSPAFTAAELDLSKFNETTPQWTPAAAYDTRKAWVGVLPDHPEFPLRIEAAAFRNRIVFFKLIYPWTLPPEKISDRNTTRNWVGIFLLAGTLIAVIITAVFLARRNLKSGSVDRRGAFKISIVVLALIFGGWLLSMNHVASFLAELDRFTHSLRMGLFVAVLTWLIYVALEPIVRRNLPELIVSWNRLLAGDWRDPLVGRDVLLGTVWGVLHLTLIYLAFLTERQVYSNRIGLELDVNQALSGLRATVAVLLGIAGNAIVNGFLVICFLAILFLLTRRRLFAGIALLLVVTTIEILLFAASPAYLPYTLAISLGSCLVVTRLGLLATLVSGIVFNWMQSILFTLNLSAWYASGMILTILLILLLLGYGFKTSLARSVVSS